MDPDRPGVPSHLNGLLERGEIDVAPCSSIEFARDVDRDLVLPDLVISAQGPVGSIVFAVNSRPDLPWRVGVPPGSPPLKKDWQSA